MNRNLGESRITELPVATRDRKEAGQALSLIDSNVALWTFPVGFLINLG